MQYAPLLNDDEEEVSTTVKDRKRDYHRRCLLYSLIIFVFVVVGVLASFLSGFPAFLFKDNDNTDTAESCKLKDACPVSSSGVVTYDAQTGFTNETGWDWTGSVKSCCQICPDNISSTVCFDSSPSSSCSNKTGNADYDYVMLDQIWLPQLCSALDSGHDPTLSHVQGMTCADYVTEGTPRLSIHRHRHA